MAYIIGDLHLDHTNIIDHSNRPYETVEEMNEALITNWNTAISPDENDHSQYIENAAGPKNPKTKPA